MANLNDKEKFILNGIYFEILSDCNLRCKHCYNSSGIKSNKLEKDVIEKIINDTKNSGLKKITISGGEPLLHPELWDILDIICEKRDITTRVITNGTLLNEDVVGRLKDYNIELQISLNGSESGIDDLIRGKNSFENTIRGLDLLSITNQMNKVIVNFVLNKYNYRDIDKTISLLEDKGVERINFNFIISSGRGKQNYSELAIDSKTLNETLNKLRIIKNNKPNLQLKIPEVLSGCSFIGKKEGISLTVRIDSEGNVFPCQIFESKNTFGIGNVYNDNLMDIVNGNKLDKLVEFMALAYEYNHKCSKCVWRFECRKGCPAKLLANGVLEQEDGLCDMRRSAFKNNLMKEIL